MAAGTDAGGPASRKALWTGRILSGLAVLFLLFDAALKLMKLRVAINATIELGYSAQFVLWIGAIEFICLLLYVIPRTSILGVILLTGYLGGAVVTHVRVGNPLFSHVLFPIYIALLLWGGLFLREGRLRSLIPFQSQTE